MSGFRAFGRSENDFHEKNHHNRNRISCLEPTGPDLTCYAAGAGVCCVSFHGSERLVLRRRRSVQIRTWLSVPDLGSSDFRHDGQKKHKWHSHQQMKMKSGKMRKHEKRSNNGNTDKVKNEKMEKCCRTNKFLHLTDVVPVTTQQHSTTRTSWHSDGSSHRMRRPSGGSPQDTHGTRVPPREEAVGGSTTHSRAHMDAHHNTGAEPLTAHITARTRPTPTTATPPFFFPTQRATNPRTGGRRPKNQSGHRRVRPPRLLRPLERILPRTQCQVRLERQLSRSG